MKKINMSIIVPSYNNDKYITECINSILRSKRIDFELIVINDGSTDATKEILDQFSDERLTVIHQENRGVSYSRNYGIKIAKGKYIAFVDSDDLLKEYAVELMMKQVDQADDDSLYFFDMIQRKYNDGEYFEEPWYINGKSFCNDSNPRLKLLNYLFQNDLYNSPCARIYSKKIIEEYEIFFPENMQFGEDGVFNILYLLNCKKVVYIPQILYIYRINISCNNSSKLHKNLQVFKNVENALEFKLRIKNEYNEIKNLDNNLIYESVINQMFSYVRQLKRSFSVKKINDEVNNYPCICQCIKCSLFAIKDTKIVIKLIYLKLFLNLK